MKFVSAMKSNLPEKLIYKLRPIMRDHALAKFGDSLVNFCYSAAKTRVTKKPAGERVQDNALAEAIRQSGLRPLMPSNITSGQIGDGAEALIGYVYLEGHLTVDKIIDLLVKELKEKNGALFNTRKERRIMMEVFLALILRIKELILDTLGGKSGG
jgi:hypothetical protein